MGTTCPDCGRQPDWGANPNWCGWCGKSKGIGKKPEIKPPAQKPQKPMGKDLHKCELCHSYNTANDMNAYEWISTNKIRRINHEGREWQCGLRWICRDCVDVIKL